MTRRVDAHGGAVSLDISQEMGLGGGSHAPSSVVELSISCRNLVDMDVFSKSDPMCVMYIKQPGSTEWREYGRTEIVWNNLNPNFVKKFVIDYFFEESQKLRFEVYDADSKSPDLRRHDFLGHMECSLGEIVSSSVWKKPLTQKSKKESIIIVSSEELSACKEKVTLKLCGRKLDKKDFFGKSDPFLLFYRTNEDGGLTVVHKTEAIKRTLNPNWPAFTIPVRALCNGDYDRSLRVECYDWDKDGGHDLIGAFSTTMRELSKGAGPSNVYDLINPKKQAKKGKKYRNSGTIELITCEIKQSHTFLDYVKGGCQIHCTIAVDFTASNGDPRQPTSLHYINPYQPSQYSMALRSVVDIIQDYDSDKLFPALGFGARLPPDGKVSHEFFLNGDTANPFCQGTEGVLAAYHQTLQRVQLYGPTNFAPCINHVAQFARQHQDGNNYFILLIITDGVITDMPQTCEALVNAARLPMSVIIVGVGDADFEAMDTLDGDEVRLSSRGQYAERDIVQFVPFRDFLGQGSNVNQMQARLAKEVLAEIPDQFLSYMETRGFSPKPALQRQPTIPTAP